MRPHNATNIAISEDISVSYFYSPGTRDLLLLLIHGLGGAKEDFLSVLEFPDLAATPLLVPDLVGHGDSAKPVSFSYSMDDQAGILAGLVDALQIDSRIAVVAHSMGGPIAVSFAERMGARVAGIGYAEGNIDADDCFYTRRIIDEFSVTEWHERGFAEFRARFQDKPKAARYALTLAKAGPLPIYRSSADLCRVSEEDTLLTRLVDLSIPVLALFGEKNRGRSGSEAKLQSRFPVKYVPEAGHYMMTDNAVSFYEVVADFLSNLG